MNKKGKEKGKAEDVGFNGNGGVLNNDMCVYKKDL